MDDVVPPKFDNNDDIDYIKCISTNTPDARVSYCSEQFGGEEVMTQTCAKKFCSYCCEAKFPPNMISKKIICEEECAAAEAPSQITAFTNCYNPFDAKHAVAKFCSTTYEEKDIKWQMNLCQRDFCQMCCVTTALQFMMNVDPE